MTQWHPRNRALIPKRQTISKLQCRFCPAIMTLSHKSRIDGSPVFMHPAGDCRLQDRLVPYWYADPYLYNMTTVEL